MIAILSPAKNMRAVPFSAEMTVPQFLPQGEQLARVLKTFSPWQLESILKVNPELALYAFELFQSFQLDDLSKQNCTRTPSLLAYHGLQYQNLAAQTLSPAELSFAQGHIRIVSGLYGLLRPLDGIQPYRLEMQCRMPQLPGSDSHSLYRYWDSILYQELFQTGECIINLASAEYSRCITPYLNPADFFLSVEFLSNRRGKLKVIATSAKMARGQMARFLIQNQVDTPEGLLSFHWDGYEYAPELSDSRRLVFLRQG